MGQRGVMSAGYVASAAPAAYHVAFGAGSFVAAAPPLACPSAHPGASVSFAAAGGPSYVAAAPPFLCAAAGVQAFPSLPPRCGSFVAGAPGGGMVQRLPSLNGTPAAGLQPPHLFTPGFSMLPPRQAMF